MEHMPSSQSKEGPDTPEKKSFEQKVLHFFNSYRARPDQPKYSYEEQAEIGRKMEEARQKFEITKDPSAKKELDGLSKEFAEGKLDKKHVSALHPPLAIAQMYLEDGGGKIPADTRKTLEAQLNDLIKKLVEAQKQEHMSDELVAESLDFMNKFEKYIS